MQAQRPLTHSTVDFLCLTVNTGNDSHGFPYIRATWVSLPLVKTHPKVQHLRMRGGKRLGSVPKVPGKGTVKST